MIEIDFTRCSCSWPHPLFTTTGPRTVRPLPHSPSHSSAPSSLILRQHITALPLLQTSIPLPLHPSLPPASAFHPSRHASEPAPQPPPHHSPPSVIPSPYIAAQRRSSEYVACGDDLLAGFTETVLDEVSDGGLLLRGDFFEDRLLLIWSLELKPLPCRHWQWKTRSAWVSKARLQRSQQRCAVQVGDIVVIRSEVFLSGGVCVWWCGLSVFSPECAVVYKALVVVVSRSVVSTAAPHDDAARFGFKTKAVLFRQRRVSAAANHPMVSVQYWHTHGHGSLSGSDNLNYI